MKEFHIILIFLVNNATFRQFKLSFNHSLVQNLLILHAFMQHNFELKIIKHQKPNHHHPLLKTTFLKCSRPWVKCCHYGYERIST
jgi:hypothetical protein